MLLFVVGFLVVLWLLLVVLAVCLCVVAARADAPMTRLLALDRWRPADRGPADVIF